MCIGNETGGKEKKWNGDAAPVNGVDAAAETMKSEKRKKNKEKKAREKGGELVRC